MATVLSLVVAPARATTKCRTSVEEFPTFLPREVVKIRDPSARKLAVRIERLPVKVSFLETPIMSSCVKPLLHGGINPVVLLHGFDSSCLEWRFTYPLLEDAGLETWALDILGWGFSDLEKLPRCDVVSKCEHLYQIWKSYIKRPMILVGPSLGAAVAIDFAVNHSEAVKKLVLIDASVFAEGTGNMMRLPRAVAYAGARLLKSIPVRFYANFLAFKKISLSSSFDWMNVGRLHCLLPWWEDATINFMLSGGYDVSSLLKQDLATRKMVGSACERDGLYYPENHRWSPLLADFAKNRGVMGLSYVLILNSTNGCTEQLKQETLIIWGENDQIISNKFALRLHEELMDSTLHLVPDCGHLPHVEKPETVAKLLLEFVQREST